MKITPLIAAPAMALMLSGCDTAVTDLLTGLTGDSIYVTTVSGNTMNLDGSYSTGCYGTSAPYTEELLVILGTSWSYTQNEHQTADCSDAATTAFALPAIPISAGGPGAISGWSDGTDAIVAPPTAADGSTLSNTEAYTSLTLTIPGGATNTMFYIVDDTNIAAGTYVLYRDNISNVAGTAGIFDPYYKQ